MKDIFCMIGIFVIILFICSHHVERPGDNIHRGETYTYIIKNQPVKIIGRFQVDTDATWNMNTFVIQLPDKTLALATTEDLKEIK